MSDDGGLGEDEFPAHYKVMLDKLNEQRRLDQFTDITLIVDGENKCLSTQPPSLSSSTLQGGCVFTAGHQFRAHKAVLAACSQFFHKFFQDFTQEPLVEIEGTTHTDILTPNTSVIGPQNMTVVI